MRILLFLCVLPFICGVYSKNNVKSLTESMGQEIIEIGAPIKDMDEEPSAEVDNEVTRSTVETATRKEFKKTTGLDRKKTGKDIDRIDGKEDDDSRIEKELAEIYKDNADYKADSGESIDTSVATTQEPSEDKPIGRAGDSLSFKFQPNVNNPKEVERFRTSIDEINCARVTKNYNIKELKDDATSVYYSAILLGFTLAVTLFCN